MDSRLEGNHDDSIHVTLPGEIGEGRTPVWFQVLGHLLRPRIQNHTTEGQLVIALSASMAV
eukprot:2719283-Amphidinium_carterae.2